LNRFSLKFIDGENFEIPSDSFIIFKQEIFYLVETLVHLTASRTKRLATNWRGVRGQPTNQVSSAKPTTELGGNGCH
jgi:hypothetical protein